MIDIRIMAHPSRKQNVINILSTLSLPKENVVWDDRDSGGDAMYTSQKAWNAPIPEGCTHRLVLQDDIELCENFIEIIEKIAKTHTNEIISLFHCEIYPNNNTKYIFAKHLWGCAIMMPITLIPKCWQYIQDIPNKLWYKRNKLDFIMQHDNDCIMLWAIENQIPVINTIPSLVQHIGNESLVGIKEHRVAKDFIKIPSVTDW